LGHAVAGHLHGLRQGLIRTGGYYPPFPPASRRNPTTSQTSAKGLRRLKGHEVSHDVIAGPCEFVRHGFPCQDRVVAALRQLVLVKALGPRLKTQGTLRRLHIGPRQIWMAIFDIARPVALAIADFGTVHTAAIRGRVAYRGKAADRTCFQRDGLSQYRADALHREQLLVSWRVMQTRMHRLF